MVQTGMRYYEAAAIHMEQINFEDMTIHIDRQYDHNHKIYTLPKNNKKRIIHINPTTLKLVRKQAIRRKKLMLAYGVKDCNLLCFNTRS